jgi:hypothetical protein
MSPERISQKFQKLLPERVAFESFWSETLNLYTEDSKLDDRGWWPRRRKQLGFLKKSALLVYGWLFFWWCK